MTISGTRKLHSEDRQQLGAWYLATVFVGAFGVVIPTLLVVDPHPSAPWTPILACGAVSLWASLRLGRLLLSNQHAIFQAAFWTFVLVFLGLSPMASMATGTWGLRPDPPRDYLLPAGLLILATLTCYEVGALLGRRHDAPTRPTSTISDRRVRLLTLVSVVTVLSSLLLLGPASFFTTRTDFTELLRTRFGEVGAQIVAAIVRFPALVAAVALLGNLRSARPVAVARRVATWTIAAIAVIVANPLTSARFLAGTALLSLWFAATPDTIRRQRFLIVGLPVALILIFPYADLFRSTTSTLEWQSARDQLSGNGDYDAFQEIARGISMIHANGLTFGTHLLGAFLFFVPRSVWPEKPVATGVEIAQYVGAAFDNISSPLWIEMYVDFGLAGVLLAFTAVGWLLVKLDHRFDADIRVGGGWWTATAPLLAFYSIVLYRGALASMAPGLLLIVITCLWIRSRRSVTDPACPRKTSD